MSAVVERTVGTGVERTTGTGVERTMGTGVERTMGTGVERTMGAVVERGTARCPRCMTLTDYRFLEEDGGLLRYEVDCKPCGNVYSELCSPTLEAPAA